MVERWWVWEIGAEGGGVGDRGQWMEAQRWRAEDRDMKDGRDVKKMKMKIDKRWRCEGCLLRSLTSN